LGLGHSPSTIMNETASGFKSLFADMVGQILRNGGIGKGQDFRDYEGAQVITKEEGSKPENFAKGKVKAVKQ
jgi:hypothetical protein